MNKAERLTEHDHSYMEFVRLVRSLTPEQLLRRSGGWAPRDVVAHLIGWNGHIRAGCDEIRSGRIRFHHSDAPNDYRTVNAGFVAEFNSADGDVLLRQLAEASTALREHGAATDEGDWTRDFEPQHHAGGPATIDRCAESITREYQEHGKEIKAGL